MIVQNHLEPKKVGTTVEKAPVSKTKTEKPRETASDEAKKVDEHKNVTREQAQVVSQELNQVFKDRGLRFVVLDPSKVGSNNVVIEVREGDKVVMQIPSKEAVKLAQTAQHRHLSEEDAKGLALPDNKA